MCSPGSPLAVALRASSSGEAWSGAKAWPGAEPRPGPESGLAWLMLPRLKLEDAIASRAPALLDESPWPPPAALRWTPAYLAERFPLLDPVRRRAKAGVFWNVDRDSAAANSRRAEGGFAFTDSVHEEAAVPTAAFFESEQPQYFSSSLLDADGAARLCSPMHERMHGRLHSHV